MSLHALPELITHGNDLASSVTLGELAGLMRAPLPLQARLADARVGLQRLAPRDVLYCSGEPFESFYVVLSGFLKLAATDDSGRERVFAFVVSGETAGVDGLQSGNHCADATALDAVEVALVPFAKLEQLAKRAGERELSEQLVHRILTQAMVQDSGLLCRLETLDARSRIAAFLLSLARRRIPVPHDLPITDAEVGSYLRLPDGVAGRVLRELVEAGLIDLGERTVSLANLAGLVALVEAGRQARVSHAVAPD